MKSLKVTFTPDEFSSGQKGEFLYWQSYKILLSKRVET